MLLWLTLLIFIGAIGALLVRPLLVEHPATGDLAATTAGAVTRDQLSEIDRELADGLMDQAQADAARLDIKRRLLKRLPDDAIVRRRLAVVERKFLAGLIAGGVGLGSLIAYGINGSPDIAAAPGTGIPAAVASAGDAGAAGAPIAAHPPSSGAVAGAAPAGAARALASVEDMIKSLAARLATAPDDANGWRMLGWSYAGTGKFKEAAEAYSKAIALQPSIGALRTARGDVLVRAADGKVTAEAKTDFEAALRMDSKDAQAHYGLGLALQQAGDAKGAIDAWVQALNHAGPNDIWATELDTRVRSMAAELKIDLSQRLAGKAPASGGVLARLNQPATDAAAVPPLRERGPTADDVKAAERLSANDRQAMIAGMVDGLQQRLDKNPRDVEGWVKLIKSRQVLGQGELAKAALVRAAAVFADAPAELGQIEAAAREAGVRR